MHVPLALLPLIGFAVALIAAPAGVSGAFLLLPLQLSVFGLSAASATSTNLLYNVVATPGGILRYAQEERVDRPITRLIVLGSVPGVVVGSVLRVSVFADPGAYRIFVGAVLIGLGAKLLVDVLFRRLAPPRASSRARSSGWIVALSAFVGVIGGIYGIGGGSFIAPYLVAVAGYSVYRVAGAALVATFVTSLAGLITYELFAAAGHGSGARWSVGLLLGVGGFAGSYAGAWLQRRLPEIGIKARRDKHLRIVILRAEACLETE